MSEQLDSLAIEAIRLGDRERYRELVERHARRVYAVAWSRLGDAHLAEEAAQEAFINGYRHLNFLSGGGKFTTWITAIARNAAINLGLRHRRELDKRARWALSQIDESSALTSDAAEPVSAETLRTALTELPPIHRECLVLFYLEGKSVAEAATALALTEGAFKTRLHRARGALREHLETRLEKSLTQLRPAPNFAQGVMALLPGDVSGPLAMGGALGALGKWLVGLLAKLSPVGFLPALIMLAGVIPGVLAGWWLGRKEQENFRDPTGFRARTYRGWLKQFLVWFPLMMIGIHALVWGFQATLGLREYLLACAVFFTLVLATSVRALRLVEHHLVRRQYGGIALQIVGFWLIGLGIVPIAGLMWFQIAFFILLAGAIRGHAPRMDFSLFLRAAHGALPDCDEAESTFACRTRAEQWAFARFLGERLLVMDYRWSGDDLWLRMMGARMSPYGQMFPMWWRKASTLTLAGDGQVLASLGANDAATLRGLPPAATTPASEAETRVACAVRAAWSAFLARDVVRAEKWIGQAGDQEIFNVAPAQSSAGRWRFGMIIAGAVCALLGAIILQFSGRIPNHSPGFLTTPVNATEADLRHTLGQLATAPLPLPGQTNFPNDDVWITYNTLLSGYALPPKEFFPAEAWARTRAELWQNIVPKNAPASGRRQIILSSLVFSAAAQRALLDGWITLDELAREGVDRAAVHEWWTNQPASGHAYLDRMSESSVQGTNYSVLMVEPLALRLRMLQRFDLLDLVDARPIITQLRAHQILPANLLSGRRPIADRAAQHGLFALMFDPLADTYQGLTILSLLGGLNEIDREACIAGILRLHTGQGKFQLPKADPPTFLFGDAKDTFAALESLKMLGALDRVKDILEWRFRPLSTTTHSSTNGPRTLSCWEIEAWEMNRQLHGSAGKKQ